MIEQQTYAEFVAAFEHFAADRSEKRDIRPVVRCLRDHVKAVRGRLLFSQIGPIAGVVWFYWTEYRKSVVKARVALFGLWLTRHVFLRNRPMWNDFEMSIWVLSRKPWAVKRVHRHLRGTIGKKSKAMQYETGARMIYWVCQEDEEFRKLWHDTVRDHGTVYPFDYGLRSA